MQAHLVQLDIAWEDKPANHARVRELLGSVRTQPGDLILLPEMFDTGFSFNVDQTHDANDRTLRFLTTLARDLGAFVQGGRTRLGSTGKGRNAAPIIDPGGRILDEYEKIHPFSFGGEPQRFERGSKLHTWRWRTNQDHLTVCPAICYDLRFPELFRRGLLMGAEVFTIGANWPQARQEHWRALLIARAIENQAYVLGVNRTGSDPHLRYAGGTIAVDPLGRVVGELDETEAVLTVQVQPDRIRSWRKRFPARQDIRLLPPPSDSPSSSGT